MIVTTIWQFFGSYVSEKLPQLKRRFPLMKKLVAFVLAMIMLAGATALADGKLVVYSPHDADPLNAGVAMFQKAYPDIDVQVIAAGTGELAQRMVAEAANPQGDVFWGGGADTLAGYVDYFEPYVCTNDAVIGDAYKDANDLWIGESPLPMVFIYNKTLIDEKDVPKTWDDLSNENLKGKIAYASPAKSGSAYTQLCTMLFSKPTLEEGWEMVFNFIKNL
ncbi:MAG: extracellular solute-binding protein, partial [Clostridia bacterium]|nr:extracellular solute-binding protein [Clostridia bacterium]